eukprot:6211865-Pleurochrysis_carterae.AAC.1
MHVRRAGRAVNPMVRQEFPELIGEEFAGVVAEQRERRQETAYVGGSFSFALEKMDGLKARVIVNEKTRVMCSHERPGYVSMNDTSRVRGCILRGITDVSRCISFCEGGAWSLKIALHTYRPELRLKGRHSRPPDAQGGDNMAKVLPNRHSVEVDSQSWLTESRESWK